MQSRVTIISSPGKYDCLLSSWTKVFKQLKKDNIQIRMVNGSVVKEEAIRKILGEEGYVITINFPHYNIKNYNGVSMYCSNRVARLIPIYYGGNLQMAKELKGEINDWPTVFFGRRELLHYAHDYYDIDGESIPMVGIKSKRHKQWSKRNCNIFYPATYLNPDDQYKVFEEVPREFAQALHRAIRVMKKDLNIDFRTAVCSALTITESAVTTEMVNALVEKFSEKVARYMNAYYRKKMVDALLAQGIEITVCGANWIYYKEQLTEEMSRCLTVLPATDYESVSNLMNDSKIVLNCTPSLREGINERTAGALLNGAFCLTNQTNDVSMTYNNNKALVTYNPNNLKTLITAVDRILRDEDQSEEIVERMKPKQEQFDVQRLVEFIKDKIDGGE